MRKIALLFLLSSLTLSFLFMFTPSGASACSCAERPTVEAQLSRSEAVFSGRVLEVKEQKSVRGYMTKAVLFEVDKVWKGGSGSQIIIRTGSGGGDCGFHFVEGTDYLVYARSSAMYGDTEQLITIICDRTSHLAEAEEDFTILGEGKAPTKKVDLSNELHRIPAYVWAVLAVLVFAIIGTVVLVVRRKIRH